MTSTLLSSCLLGFESTYDDWPIVTLSQEATLLPVSLRCFRNSPGSNVLELEPVPRATSFTAVACVWLLRHYGAWNVCSGLSLGSGAQVAQRAATSFVQSSLVSTGMLANANKPSLQRPCACLLLFGRGFLEASVSDKMIPKGKLCGLADWLAGGANFCKIPTVQQVGISSCCRLRPDTNKKVVC